MIIVMEYDTLLAMISFLPDCFHVICFSIPRAISQGHLSMRRTGWMREEQIKLHKKNLERRFVFELIGLMYTQNHHCLTPKHVKCKICL